MLVLKEFSHLWTDESNGLKITSAKSILMLQYNCKDMTGVGFHDYLMNKDVLLKEVTIW